MKHLFFLSALLFFACKSEDDNNNDCNQENDFTLSCSSPSPSIVYGTQEWTVENACHTSYRDGTPIPQVTDEVEWTNLTTGAWCYYDNDPSKGVLYNWYAVMGIHDNISNTPNKVFAPLGWHVPSQSEWITFEGYLIQNGYNSEAVTPIPVPYYGNRYNNFLAKSLASSSGWKCPNDGGQYYLSLNQSTNNSSGFNAFPAGNRFVGYSQGTPVNSTFMQWGSEARFWSSSTAYDSANNRTDPVFSSLDSNLWYSILGRPNGLSVRLLKN